MARERKKPAARRITSLNNGRTDVRRIVKRTTLQDESKEATDSTVDEQVAALKKIPVDRIGKNEIEIKAAETAARLGEVLLENAHLTSVAESARKETEKYRQLNAKVAEETKRAIESGIESEKQRLKADKIIDKLQDEIQDLRKELNEKARPEKHVEYLRVQHDQIVEMMTDFESAISNSLSGLILSNLELRLKVAVDIEENKAVLLIPPITRRKINSEKINELIVRLLPSGVMGIP